MGVRLTIGYKDINIVRICSESATIFFITHELINEKSLQGRQDGRCELKSVRFFIVTKRAV
jgi:hypothetical protein